ncbi:MAG: hypothetical protein BWX61_01368 [Bacteroidetes bacterium ADurb.Bin035]|jgi:hypothetical protein|nr:MAG: hypothetical protein BWX61_01368 [Bacteroidetes bacterium ADurb.Bin035]HNT70481.1 hypothetical protein [Bacteroidales bacterium]HOH93778.1 hypothetical protein [Bacteroidales bacterium]HPB19729.1 hypothetical protein [Bacteroidales bacterium]HQJ58707.1 hypothetical protein [Bacteroidales bacterium]
MNSKEIFSLILNNIEKPWYFKEIIFEIYNSKNFGRLMIQTHFERGSELMLQNSIQIIGKDVKCPNVNIVNLL